MAKTRAKAGRGDGRGVGRRLDVRVFTTRTGYSDRKMAFRACAYSGARRGQGGYPDCAYGKNPRAAIAKALGSTAKRIARRSGAFAGTKG